MEWKKTVCVLLIKLCILIYGVEYWSGVESDFGVAKLEWSAVVMCVCVCVWPSFMLYCNSDGSVTHTSQLHSILLLQLQNLTPLVCSKTPLQDSTPCYTVLQLDIA